MRDAPTWTSDVPPPEARIDAAGWARVVWKAAVIGTVTFGGLALLLLLRLVERPVHGAARPWTPRITMAVCRTALRVIGLQRHTTGAPMDGPGALVANHASWLDIFVLNAGAPVYFVSKSEVAGWPGIGWLARATGTLFIRRSPGEARRQVAEIAGRLEAGHQLLLFPEGTSTDGRRVLPFRTTLFQPFVAAGDGVRVQPVTVVYHAPEDRDPRLYGWWGDMDFGAHLIRTLAAPRHGRVDVVFHAPLPVSDDRKTLAAAAEDAVRTAFVARVTEVP